MRIRRFTKLTELDVLNRNNKRQGVTFSRQGIVRIIRAEALVSSYTLAKYKAYKINICIN